MIFMIDNLYLPQDWGEKEERIPGSVRDQMIQLSRDKVEYVQELHSVTKQQNDMYSNKETDVLLFAIAHNKHYSGKM